MHWIISDIHGCFTDFIKLKEKIEYQDKKAEIIIAGDIMDRGPQVKELLTWCMENVNKPGSPYICLMGNHEELIIDWYENEFLQWWSGKLRVFPETMFDFAGLVTKNQWDAPDLLEPMITFMREMPLYKVVDLEKKKFLIVHAWAPKEDKMNEIIVGRSITESEKSIFLWDRRINEPYKSEDFWLIHGHTPTTDGVNMKKAKIDRHDNVVNIDCGCNWRNIGGRLSALCLETEKVIYQ